MHTPQCRAVQCSAEVQSRPMQRYRAVQCNDTEQSNPVPRCRAVLDLLVGHDQSNVICSELWGLPDSPLLIPAPTTPVPAASLLSSDSILLSLLALNRPSTDCLSIVFVSLSFAILSRSFAIISRSFAIISRSFVNHLLSFLDHLLSFLNHLLSFVNHLLSFLDHLLSFCINLSLTVH